MNEVGVGTRVLNFLVDTLVIFLMSYGFYKWYSFYVFYWDYKPIQFYLFFFANTFVYYFIFELIFLRTPGKWFTMSKVKSIAGKRPPWYFIFIRSLLRLTIIDAFFIAFLERPLHDALSSTRVVEV